MTDRGRTLHDLSDRLNSVAISVELAVQLLGSGHAEVTKLLERVLDDCGACSELMARLREEAD